MLLCRSEETKEKVVFTFTRNFFTFLSKCESESSGDSLRERQQLEFTLLVTALTWACVSFRREMELLLRPPTTAISVLKFCNWSSFCQWRTETDLIRIEVSKQTSGAVRISMFICRKTFFFHRYISSLKYHILVTLLASRAVNNNQVSLIIENRIDKTIARNCGLTTGYF